MKNILLVIAVAGVSYFAWSHYFSRSARIERAYQACLSNLNAGVDQAKTNIRAQTPGGSDPSSAMAKGMSDAMASMLQGMSGAMCGMIKDSCKQDFDGPVCQAALNSRR